MPVENGEANAEKAHSFEVISPQAKSTTVENRVSEEVYSDEISAVIIRERLSLYARLNEGASTLGTNANARALAKQKSEHQSSLQHCEDPSANSADKEGNYLSTVYGPPTITRIGSNSRVRPWRRFNVYQQQNTRIMSYAAPRMSDDTTTQDLKQLYANLKLGYACPPHAETQNQPPGKLSDLTAEGSDMMRNTPSACGRQEETSVTFHYSSSDSAKVVHGGTESLIGGITREDSSPYEAEKLEDNLGDDINLSESTGEERRCVENVVKNILKCICDVAVSQHFYTTEDDFSEHAMTNATLSIESSNNGYVAMDGIDFDHCHSERGLTESKETRINAEMSHVTTISLPGIINGDNPACSTSIVANNVALTKVAHHDSKCSLNYCQESLPCSDCHVEREVNPRFVQENLDTTPDLQESDWLDWRSRHQQKDDNICKNVDSNPATPDIELSTLPVTHQLSSTVDPSFHSSESPNKEQGSNSPQCEVAGRAAKQVNSSPSKVSSTDIGDCNACSSGSSDKVSGLLEFDLKLQQKSDDARKNVDSNPVTPVIEGSTAPVAHELQTTMDPNIHSSESSDKEQGSHSTQYKDASRMTVEYSSPSKASSMDNGDFSLGSNGLHDKVSDRVSRFQQKVGDFHKNMDWDLVTPEIAQSTSPMAHQSSAAADPGINSSESSNKEQGPHSTQCKDACGSANQGILSLNKASSMGNIVMPFCVTNIKTRLFDQTCNITPIKCTVVASVNVSPTSIPSFPSPSAKSNITTTGNKVDTSNPLNVLATSLDKLDKGVAVDATDNIMTSERSKELISPGIVDDETHIKVVDVEGAIKEMAYIDKVISPIKEVNDTGIDKKFSEEVDELDDLDCSKCTKCVSCNHGELKIDVNLNDKISNRSIKISSPLIESGNHWDSRGNDGISETPSKMDGLSQMEGVTIHDELNRSTDSTLYDNENLIVTCFIDEPQTSDTSGLESTETSFSQENPNSSFKSACPPEHLKELSVDLHDLHFELSDSLSPETYDSSEFEKVPLDRFTDSKRVTVVLNKDDNGFCEEINDTNKESDEMSITDRVDMLTPCIAHDNDSAPTSAGKDISVESPCGKRDLGSSSECPLTLTAIENTSENGKAKAPPLTLVDCDAVITSVTSPEMIFEDGNTSVASPERIFEDGKSSRGIFKDEADGESQNACDVTSSDQLKNNGIESMISINESSAANDASFESRKDVSLEANDASAVAMDTGKHIHSTVVAFSHNEKSECHSTIESSCNNDVATPGVYCQQTQDEVEMEKTKSNADSMNGCNSVVVMPECHVKQTYDVDEVAAEVAKDSTNDIFSNTVVAEGAKDSTNDRFSITVVSHRHFQQVCDKNKTHSEDDTKSLGNNFDHAEDILQESDCLLVEENGFANEKSSCGDSKFRSNTTSGYNVREDADAISADGALLRATPANSMLTSGLVDVVSTVDAALLRNFTSHSHHVALVGTSDIPVLHESVLEKGVCCPCAPQLQGESKNCIMSIGCNELPKISHTKSDDAFQVKELHVLNGVNPSLNMEYKADSSQVSNTRILGNASYGDYGVSVSHGYGMECHYEPFTRLLKGRPKQPVAILSSKLEVPPVDIAISNSEQSTDDNLEKLASNDVDRKTKATRVSVLCHNAPQDQDYAMPTVAISKTDTRLANSYDTTPGFNDIKRVLLAKAKSLNRPSKTLECHEKMVPTLENGKLENTDVNAKFQDIRSNKESSTSNNECFSHIMESQDVGTGKADGNSDSDEYEEIFPGIPAALVKPAVAFVQSIMEPTFGKTCRDSIKKKPLSTIKKSSSEGKKGRLPRLQCNLIPTGSKVGGEEIATNDTHVEKGSKRKRKRSSSQCDSYKQGESEKTTVVKKRKGRPPKKIKLHNEPSISKDKQSALPASGYNTVSRGNVLPKSRKSRTTLTKQTRSTSTTTYTTDSSHSCNASTYSETTASHKAKRNRSMSLSTERTVGTLEQNGNDSNASSLGNHPTDLVKTSMISTIVSDFPDPKAPVTCRAIKKVPLHLEPRMSTPFSKCLDYDLKLQKQTIVSITPMEHDGTLPPHYSVDLKLMGKNDKDTVCDSENDSMPPCQDMELNTLHSNITERPTCLVIPEIPENTTVLKSSPVLWSKSRGSFFSDAKLPISSSNANLHCPNNSPERNPRIETVSMSQLHSSILTNPIPHLQSLSGKYDSDVNTQYCVTQATIGEPCVIKSVSDRPRVSIDVTNEYKSQVSPPVIQESSSIRTDRNLQQHCSNEILGNEGHSNAALQMMHSIIQSSQERFLQNCGSDLFNQYLSLRSSCLKNTLFVPESPPTLFNPSAMNDCGSSLSRSFSDSNHDSSDSKILTSIAEPTKDQSSSNHVPLSLSQSKTSSSINSLVDSDLQLLISEELLRINQEAPDVCLSQQSVVTDNNCITTAIQSSTASSMKQKSKYKELTLEDKGNRPKLNAKTRKKVSKVSSLKSKVISPRQIVKDFSHSVPSKSLRMLHGISCKNTGVKYHKKRTDRSSFNSRKTDQTDLPFSILADREQRDILKKSKSSFVQDAPCFDIARMYGVETSGLTIGNHVWRKCRECRFNKHRDSAAVFCRFYGFRKLQFKDNLLCTAGFLLPEECTKKDLQLWLPQENCFHQPNLKENKNVLSPNGPFEPNVADFILSNIGKRFCEIALIEEKALSWIVKDEIIYWKKPVPGVRDLCDVCETTLFNIHWICHKCGYGVCLDCFERRLSKSIQEQAEYDSEKANTFRWERCTKGKYHFHANMIPTQIIPSTCLVDLNEKMHNICKIRNVQTSCRCLKVMKKKLSQGAKANLCEADPVNQQRQGNEKPLKRVGKRRMSDVDSPQKKKLKVLHRSKSEECQLRESNMELSNLQPSIRLVDFLEGDGLPEEDECCRSECLDNCSGNQQTIDRRSEEPQLQWLCDGRLLQLTDSQHPGNLELFKRHWKQGMPVIVSGVGNYLNMDLWHPARLSSEYGDEESRNSLINCLTGSIVTNVKIKDFWDGFENISHRLCDEENKTMILKLKDWPPTEAFHDVMPEMFQDLMHALPLPEYTYIGGRCNLASRLPHFFVKPDLGPKMYNAYGWVTETNWKQGTTNLHLDISDAVNVMVYVGIPHDEPPEAKERLELIVRDGDVDEIQRLRAVNEKPGALWHIFHEKDVDKIRQFIKSVWTERGEVDAADHDPIHDQQMYLDKGLRQRLKEEYGVEGYGIVQCEGDGVFIPAGAPHQVFNLHSCIKIAEDFVSPEHVDKCFNLTNEFRYLSSTHSNHEDKLQIKNIIYHAVKDIVSSAIHQHCL